MLHSEPDGYSLAICEREMEHFPGCQWIDRLTSEDASARDAASRELGGVLTRNLRSYFLRRDLSEDCVEDVVQEALLRILNRLSTFRRDSRFTTWATAIGVRTGLELIRKQYWKTQTLGDLVSSEDVDLVGPWECAERNPQIGIDRLEVLSVLSTAIQTVLTDRQRIALLAEMKGMPTSEIAAELDSSRGTVYKITHDARKKLKAELERQGFDASEVLSSIHTS